MLKLSKVKTERLNGLEPVQPITQMVSHDRMKLIFPYKWLYKGEEEIIHQGFEWDGATIFRIFYTLLGVCRFGYINPASVIHDFLYVNKGVLPSGKQLSREEADNLFFEHIMQLGIVKSNELWKYRFALRYGGLYFSSWKEKY